MDTQNTMTIFIIILILIIICFICIYNNFNLGNILADARNITCICLFLLIGSSIIALMAFINNKKTDPSTNVFNNPFAHYANQTNNQSNNQPAIVNTPAAVVNSHPMVSNTQPANLQHSSVSQHLSNMYNLYNKAMTDPNLNKIYNSYFSQTSK